MCFCGRIEFALYGFVFLSLWNIFYQILLLYTTHHLTTSTSIEENSMYIVSMLFDDFLKTAKDIKVNAYTAQELSSTMTLNF